MRPVLPLELLPVGQAKVCLVDQRGSLQGVAGPLAPHVAAGDPPQFLVKDGHNLFHRPAVAARESA